MARVSEEGGKGGKGFLAHVRRAVLQSGLVGARVRGATRLLQVAVREGKGQSSLFGVAERVTRGVELRDGLGPTRVV